ncbi:TlpA disulfide reductase family protein [Mangrovimonas aestuarii]|uniref:TlpA disulfide reductase family protein n=1 Tax=Mangrovimonas aestuarii TaxID=3018443 RepID=UPI0023787ED5|nr:TlpA disulfide reductase family protein [Mangrovimonas aestuarii]
MLRHALLTGVGLLALTACNNETSSNGYTINGDIAGIDNGTKVFLKTVKDNKLVDVDTTEVNNNSFSFVGNSDNLDVHFVSVENLTYNLPFVLENDNIDLIIYKDSLNKSLAQGSKENNLLRQYQKHNLNLSKKNFEIRNEMRLAQTENDSAKLAEATESYKQLMTDSENYEMNFVKENKDSFVAMLILESLLNRKKGTAKEINDIYQSMPEKMKETRPGKGIGTSLHAALATAEGSKAPDFTAPTPDGKEITLSDVKGKVTIIDFWASWCGPCRRENPNVVKVYEKYHDKGLEIVGVSLDGSPRQKDAKNAWLEAIEKDNLTWHHVSNLNYFNDPIAKEYNIKSIPATFIIDENGVIIAKNLRGQALEDKIAELLN